MAAAAAGGGGGDSVRAGSRAVGFVDASSADAASLGDGDGVGIWPIAKVRTICEDGTYAF